MVAEQTPELQPTAPLILVVTDEPAAADTLARFLQDAGYAVEVAADMAGLVKVDVHAVDLVLLDLASTHLDGLKLCRWLRAYQTTLYLPIIALTPSADSRERHASFSAGVDDSVSGPYDPEELLDRVEVWVRTRRRLQAAHDARVVQAQTSSDTLTGVLSTMQTILKRWSGVYYPPEDARQVQVALQHAVSELSAALDTLSSTVPEESSGYTEYYLSVPRRS